MVEPMSVLTVSDGTTREFPTRLASGYVEFYLTGEPIGTEVTLSIDDNCSLYDLWMALGCERDNVPKYYSSVNCHTDNGDVGHAFIMADATKSAIDASIVNEKSVKLTRVNPANIIKRMTEQDISMNEFCGDKANLRRFRSYLNRLSELGYDNTCQCDSTKEFTVAD